MGQNSKVGQSSYSKITIQPSEKEKLHLHYEEVSNIEIKAHAKRERYLFMYQIMFVVTLILLAFVKEIYFPSHLEWVDWIVQKFH